MPEGCYHLVSIVWIYNSKGELLISQRHPSKPFGLKWECTGGSVISGEDSLAGAVREVSEELGLTLNPKDGVLIRSVIREEIQDFIDEWLFYSETPVEKLTFQPSEVVDAKWASFEEVDALFSSEEFSMLNRRYRQVFSTVRELLAKELFRCKYNLSLHEFYCCRCSL
jgi:isopentenyldiphosphate isomerase